MGVGVGVVGPAGRLCPARHLAGGSQPLAPSEAPLLSAPPSPGQLRSPCPPDCPLGLSHPKVGGGPRGGAGLAPPPPSPSLLVLLHPPSTAPATGGGEWTLCPWLIVSTREPELTGGTGWPLGGGGGESRWSVFLPRGQGVYLGPPTPCRDCSWGDGRPLPFPPRSVNTWI